MKLENLKNTSHNTFEFQLIILEIIGHNTGTVAAADR